jgi:hypothetical protein
MSMLTGLVGLSGFAGSGKDAGGNFLVQDFGFCKVALADPLKRIARDVYAFTDEQLWGASQFRNAPDKRYPRPCKTCEGRGSILLSITRPPGTPTNPCYSCKGEGVTYLTPREALQKLGTEWGRECYPNTWVDLCIRTGEYLLHFPHARYDQKKGVYHVVDPSESLHSADTIFDGRVRGVAITDVRFKNEIEAIKGAGGYVIRIARPGAGLDGSGALHVSETEQAGIPDSTFDAVIPNTGTLDDLRTKIREYMSAAWGS